MLRKFSPIVLTLGIFFYLSYLLSSYYGKFYFWAILIFFFRQLAVSWTFSAPFNKQVLMLCRA